MAKTPSQQTHKVCVAIDVCKTNSLRVPLQEKLENIGKPSRPSEFVMFSVGYDAGLYLEFVFVFCIERFHELTEVFDIAGLGGFRFSLAVSGIEP
jgi:hypothetical protein